MDNPVVFLVSTKKDLEDEWKVSADNVEEWLGAHGEIPHYVISSLDGTGCDELW